MGAFEEWYRGTYPDLFSSVFRITRGDRAMTEDLCHDAILEFITKGHFEKAADAKSALAYLRRMTANALVDQIRHSRRTPNLPREMTQEPDPGEAAASAREVYALLIERLPPEDHEILGMMFEGESLSNIAAALDITYSNAGVKVHRIRRIIKELEK